MIFEKASPLLDEASKINCDFCDGKFKTRKSYLEHVKKYHNGKLPNPDKRDSKATCKILLPKTNNRCGVKIPLHYFNTHLLKIHGIERPSRLHFFRGFNVHNNQPIFLKINDPDPINMIPKQCQKENSKFHQQVLTQYFKPKSTHKETRANNEYSEQKSVETQTYFSCIYENTILKFIKNSNKSQNIRNLMDQAQEIIPLSQEKSW